MFKLAIDDIPKSPMQQLEAEMLFDRLAQECIRSSSGSDLSYSRLLEENKLFSGTGGISQNNFEFGFLPAFRNDDTNEVILSRTSSGQIAPIHTLEGIPKEWFCVVENDNHKQALLNVITSGFVRQGVFYTREAAAKAVKIFNLEDDL